MNTDAAMETARETGEGAPDEALVRALRDILRTSQSNIDLPECHADALETIARIAENALKGASSRRDGS